MVGVEVSRVNCGGVSAHLSDGFVMRSILANPASRLVGVSVLEGNERGLAEVAVKRIRAIEAFGREKRKFGMPDEEARVEWCLHITCDEAGEEVVDAIVQTLAQALGVAMGCKEVKEFHKILRFGFPIDEKSNEETQVLESQKLPKNTMESLEKSSDEIKKRPTARRTVTSKSEKGDIEGSVLEVVPTQPSIFEKQKEISPFWNFTFMSTFDAVSEFTTGTTASRISGTVIGAISFLAILMLQILALWQNDWILSVGWLLVITGYVGIVFGVMFAAIVIHSSCICINLLAGNSKSENGLWKEGMVVSVKNTDSMDTTGSNFVSNNTKHQTLEAVWIKLSTRKERLKATLITASLVFAFIGHYLGLRAVKWWASVGELCVCIAAAFARSISNEQQRRFKEVKGVKIDKRCTSTGVIRTQTARLVTDESKSVVLDARAYSPRLLYNPPTTGERVAYQTAKLCFQESKVAEFILKLTGMKVACMQQGQRENSRAILTIFTGGVLVSEGLAFPNAQLCLAFSSNLTDLAAPTALLARAIMRQPEWRLNPNFGKGIPLGNVYVFGVQNMMDWWTLSEDRNDMGDLQRNLHWPMFLVNVGFFLGLLGVGKGDEEFLGEIERVHGGSGGSERKVAEDVVQWLRSHADDVNDVS